MRFRFLAAGILVVIGIGVALGVAVGIVLLMSILICFRRYVSHGYPHLLQKVRLTWVSSSASEGTSLTCTLLWFTWYVPREYTLSCFSGYSMFLIGTLMSRSTLIWKVCPQLLQNVFRCAPTNPPFSCRSRWVFVLFFLSGSSHKIWSRSTNKGAFLSWYWRDLNSLFWP